MDKRRIVRRLTIGIIVAMALSMIAISLDSASGSKGIPDFTYADLVEFYPERAESANGIDEIPDERLNALLEIAKRELVTNKEELEETGTKLDWSVLDDVRIYYSSKFVDETGEECNVQGHYNNKKNALEISILAKEYEISDVELVETIVHETLHGLLKKSTIDEYIGASIWEAFTEYLSEIVVDDYTPYYSEELQILKMLFNIWGEKETISYLQEDKLIDKLGELTSEKYARESIMALDYFSEMKKSGTYSSDTVEISQEVLANATANATGSVRKKKLFLDLLVQCADIEHYKKILGIK